MSSNDKRYDIMKEIFGTLWYEAPEELTDDLISELSRRVAIPSGITRMLDSDIAAAALLCQLLFWTGVVIRTRKNVKENPWIYKTYYDLWVEIGLTEYKIRHAARKLQDLGLIKIEIKRANGAPTCHYRVNILKTRSMLQKYAVEAKHARRQKPEQHEIVCEVPQECVQDEDLDFDVDRIEGDDLENALIFGGEPIKATPMDQVSEDKPEAQDKAGSDQPAEEKPEWEKEFDAILDEAENAHEPEGDTLLPAILDNLIVVPAVSQETLTEKTTEKTDIKYAREIFSKSEAKAESDSGGVHPFGLPTIRPPIPPGLKTISPLSSTPPTPPEICEHSHDLPANLPEPEGLGKDSAPRAGMIGGVDDLPKTIADVPPPADDGDYGEVMRWLGEVDAVKSRNAPPVSRSSDDIRLGVGVALQKYARGRDQSLQDFEASGIASGEAAGIIDFLAGVPEDLRPLAREFCAHFGRGPIKRERKGWISEFRIQADLGIVPDDISEAFRGAEKDTLTIKSPQSVTAMAESVKRRRKSNGALPGERKIKRGVVLSDGARKLLEGDGG